MSMTKQLWSAIIVSMLLALGGSLLASLLSARGYMTEQLTLKNIDNANTLALSLSQGEIDNVRIELAVAALFDNGQYQLVRVTGPRGKIIVERTSAFVPHAPSWFVSLLPIEAEPGVARINNGWKQIGLITLQSETRFAYRSLWKSALQMTLTLTLACLVAGYLGSLILRRLIPPLREVVNQANDITQRRFATIALPKVPELAKLAEAMNLMVTRLQSMFDQEALRLEAVRQEANFDALTGIANRNFFMARFRQSLEESSSGGLLLLLRIARLAEINQQLGRGPTDELLRAIGEKLASVGAKTGTTLVGRLGGSDFALHGVGLTADSISKTLYDLVIAEAPRFGLDPEHFTHIGSVVFAPGIDMSLVLAQADAGLAAAEAKGRGGVVSNSLSLAATNHPRSAAEWERALVTALQSRQFRLESYPVANRQGNIVAHEFALRLRFGKDGEWLPAARFLPLAERLRMTSNLDIIALELGIEALDKQTPGGGIVLNLSPQSIADDGFRHNLVALVGKHHRIAPRLWLETAESGAIVHLHALAALCRELAPFGCHVGIEHFGHEFGKIGHLLQIGLAYLKVDSSFVSGIDQNTGNQAFLRGLRTITSTTGTELHAEGVKTKDEARQLALLGFDAVTGPGIREN
jgi:EAL domain-containing protein (putative c-di-GMP-specific phosphodiesterase class I)/GGDEF domain-containing protein